MNLLTLLHIFVLLITCCCSDPNAPRPSHAGEEAVIKHMMEKMKINNTSNTSGTGGHTHSGNKVRADSTAPDEDR